MRYRWWLGGRVLLMLALLLVVAKATDAAIPPPPVMLAVSLADPDMTLVGEDNGDWAAYFASPAGDMNGDGLGDFLIGAPIAGNKVCPYPQDPCPGLPKGEGEVYLVLGRPEGEWLPNPVNMGDSDASFVGCEINSMTGRQVYTAGDVNGDGYDDILISGWKCGANYTGKAYLVLGRPDPAETWGKKFPVEDASIISFLGENEWDFLSYYVASAGDVNADGYDDLLITSTHNSESAYHAGQMYLILGRPEADWGQDYPVSQADASFLGTAESDRLGRSAHGVGDVNGDGFDDFVVASISSDTNGFDAGENYLFLGRPFTSTTWWGMDYPVSQADASFVGEGEGDEAGRRVSQAGDVNSDGLDDFLIGSARNDHGGLDAGIGYLILGRAEADWGMAYPLAEADASFPGEDPRDQAGRRLSGVGDVNHDGYDDFIIGAPHNTRGGFAAGSAYLIYGKPMADWGLLHSLSFADVVYVGKEEVGVAGYDMAWLNDFNGDGIDDMGIAAFGGRNNQDVPGEAYIILGSDVPSAMELTPGDVEGRPGTWHLFTSLFWEPNGTADFDEVRLALTGDVPGYDVEVAYRVVSNTLHIRLAEGGWRGPCTPGDGAKLSNSNDPGGVSLDCRGTRVNLTDHAVQVIWRLGWPPDALETITFETSLQARDQANHDTGQVLFEPWVLRSWRVFLPLIMRQ